MQLRAENAAGNSHPLLMNRGNYVERLIGL